MAQSLMLLYQGRCSQAPRRWSHGRSVRSERRILVAGAKLESMGLGS